jgi:hypothetical protein
MAETHYLHATPRHAPCRLLAAISGRLVLGSDKGAPVLKLTELAGPGDQGRSTMLMYGDMLTVDVDTGRVTDTQDHVVATLGEQVTIGGGFEPEILAFRVGSITRADPASAASR